MAGIDFRSLNQYHKYGKTDGLDPMILDTPPNSGVERWRYTARNWSTYIILSRKLKAKGKHILAERARLKAASMHAG